MFPFKIQDELLRALVKEHFSKGPVFNSIEQLNYSAISEEKLVRVQNTKVIYANYKLLQHDFPQLSDETLKRRYPADFPHNKEKIIDAWLVDNASFISKQQSQQENVNSPIDCSDETTTAHRPSLYGRAVIYSIAENIKTKYQGNVPIEEINDQGLLDVKGVGVAVGKRPSFRAHSDGLLGLDDAFIEYLNRQLIQGIFMHAQSNYETLPNYGIIDLGFNVKSSDKVEMPACLLIRRAHTRPSNKGGLPKYGSPQQKVQLDIELLIRKYGLTSVNIYTSIKIWKENEKFKLQYGRTQMRHLTEAQLKNIEEVSHFKGQSMVFEGVNIQHTGEYSFHPKPCTCQLVDFGSYLFQYVHENPVLSLVSDRLMRWGGSIFQGSDRYVQPDSEIAVPEEYWGKRTTLFGFETEYDTFKRNVICIGLALAYGAEKVTRKKIIEQLDAYLQTATILWRDKIIESAIKED